MHDVNLSYAMNWKLGPGSTGSSLPLLYPSIKNSILVRVKILALL